MTQRIRVMAKFEISLVLIKKNNNKEIYTDNLNYVCFCEDTYDKEEINEKTDKIMSDQISESEDQILFGSAHIIVKGNHVSSITFENKEYDTDQMEKILSLILDDTRETIH